jgi:hypothetical protein
MKKLSTELKFAGDQTINAEHTFGIGRLQGKV